MEKEDNEHKIYHKQVKGIIWRSDNIQGQAVLEKNPCGGKQAVTHQDFPYMCLWVRDDHPRHESYDNNHHHKNSYHRECSVPQILKNIY